MALIPFLIFLTLSNGLAAVQTPFLGGKYHALIIGNNDYQDTLGKWDTLSNPINDAKAVADVLTRRYAFSPANIRLLTDAKRGEILRELKELAEKVRPADSVVVFYAGHGYLNEKTGEAYWIPVDAQGMEEANYIRHETIKEKLSIIADNASHVLLVSDSCFSGKLVRDTRGRGIHFQPNQPGYYNKKAKLKSIQVIAAGGTEFVDDNFRSTGHSPFTYFFLNELENNGKQYLAVSEFITNVEKNVANSVRQTPVLGRLYGAGDESGEFIFTQKNLARVDIEREIEQLLEAAEDYFDQGDLIDPPLNNARKSWVEVLRLDPSNRAARQGLARIADYYVATTREHIEQGRFDETTKSLQTAADVKPDYSEIGPAQEELEKAKNNVPAPIIPW